MLVYLQMIETEESKSKFRAIYREYKNLMYHIAFQRLGQVEDAEDAVQHVFMKVAEHIGKIEPVSDRTRQLMVTMVANRANDLLRARARLQGWSRETEPGAVTYRKSSVFIPKTEISRFGLGWVPEGYTLQRERVFGSSFSLMYSNEQGQLLWVRCTYAGNVMIAADQSVAEPCIVSGREGEFFRSNDPKVSSDVVWIDAQGRLLGVSGFFSKEELIRLAESIYEK